MATINFRPEPIHVVQVVAGTDVRFILDGLGDDLSGDTYAPIVTTATGTEIVGTGTIDTTDVEVAFTDEQTIAMGAGKHTWLLWRTRDGLKATIVGGTFEVID